jgi:hypothetical protein
VAEPGRTKTAWRSAVRECLAQAVLPPGLDAEQLSALVLAVMEGAVMQSRTYRNADAFDACVAQLRVLLRAGTAPKRRRPGRS